MDTKEHKILILEDNPADAELVKHELLNGGLTYLSECVSTREDFSNALNTFLPDLILSDYNLPSFDGLSALAIAQEKYPDTPFIFVTGAMGDELAVNTLKQGAVDYVLKNKLSLLVPAVERAFRNVESLAKEKEAERTKEAFINLASHQLRTPLSGTKWLIETLRRELHGPINLKQKEYLDQIFEINEHMIKLVFDILSALHFENDSDLVKKETISATDFLEKVFTAKEPVAKDKGMILRDVFGGYERMVIETDPGILDLILAGFISNAINYSERGKEILLDLKEEDDDIVFSVGDRGIGIPKAEQERIFERFYRAGNAKAFLPDGTGLGLFTAVRFAEKIGAKISFESEEGQGTTFYLRVPKKAEARRTKILATKI